jgi:hypothetical protein
MNPKAHPDESDYFEGALVPKWYKKTKNFIIKIVKKMIKILAFLFE